MRALCLAAAAAFVLSAPASGVVVNLGASQDNTLFEDPAGSLSSGAGQWLFAGYTAQNAKRRGLLGFNLSTIPAGSTINSVRLTLHMSRTITATELITLHEVTSSWGEGTSDSNAMGGGAGAPATAGDATWLHRFYDTSTWNTAGGDFNPTALATTSVAGIGFYSWSTPAMAAQVQSWLNTPSTNNGWMLIGNEADPGAVKRFDSRENLTVANRPVLVVDYTPIPGIGSVTALSAIGLAGALRRRR